jgi:hypothetical protein
MGSVVRHVHGNEPLPDPPFNPGRRHPQDWKLRQGEILKEIEQSAKRVRLGPARRPR